MTREGTRSATGNSRPRIFPAVDVTPTFKRKKPTIARTKKTPVAPAAGNGSLGRAKAKIKAATGLRSTGVTKKKAAPKKPTTTAKVKAAVKNAEAKVTGKTVV